MPSASASAATSSGQSAIRRRRWNEESPIPGRSTEISRTPACAGASGKHTGSSRDAGVPWK
ncbi:MAG TPA: hypothetical protein VH231_04440 [Solirubrobacteraceae bacterium]|jgi:hypothetical protein|nr:hypothetical protein [Solirubrobacteraceae bacterium]